MISAQVIPAVDRTLALMGLVVLAPLVALAGLGVKFSSRGPVIYRARRAGLDGREFTMYKIRTMHLGSGASGRITGSNDSRVFPVGKLLRRAKLDEVPQLVNVLKGDMALVGPRPEDVSIVVDHYDSMMWESLRVRPGITSPGSLHYFAGESSLPRDPQDAEHRYLAELLPRKIALDLAYVRGRTLSYHLEILMRTALGVIGVRGPFARRIAWEEAQATRTLAARSGAGGDE